MFSFKRVTVKNETFYNPQLQSGLNMERNNFINPIKKPTLKKDVNYVQGPQSTENP